MAPCAVLGVALVALARIVHAAPCASTGADAPAVTTLMASDDPMAAWIVARDCTTRRVNVVIETYQFREIFVLKEFSSDVERVDSVPAKTTSFIAKNTKLTRGADLSSSTTLETVMFTSNGFSTLDAIKLPSTVRQLTIENSAITSLRNFNWPASLETLSLKGSKITAVDPSARLPGSLKTLDISSTGVSALRGFKLPASLQSIDVTGLNIRYVEVRQSDVAVFSQVGGLGGLTTQSTCGASGQAQQIGAMTVCVISDATFDALYSGSNPNNGANTPPSGGGDSGGAGGNSSGDGDSGGGGGGTSGSTTGNTKPKTTKPHKVSMNSTSAGSTTGEADTATTGSTNTALGSVNRTKSAAAKAHDGASSSLDFEGSTLVDGETRRPGRTTTSRPPSTLDGATKTASSSSYSSKTLPIAIGLILGAVGLVTGFVVYHRRNAKSSASKLDDETHTDSTKHTQWTELTDNNSLLDTSDLLHDKALIPFHIEWRNIGVEKLIARGGYGDVYRGVYNGEAVAIKHMVQQDNADVAAEIRMCARLDHPRIVEFIGITWTDRHAISIVLELMEGGDLYMHLMSQSSSSSPRDWSQSWTTTTTLKSKASIAQDVAEAVVYLHSFQTPILHRDLKARNVLLSNTGDAKLSDFGISREAAIDETMTREVGTAAWIAPEVLRGKRYNEKADIYSLGVLLVEMDTARHPFSTLLRRDGAPVKDPTHASTTIAALQNAQLIVAIGNGELRPTVSNTCPDEIKNIAEACLSLDADTRPTAMEVYYRLRQFCRRQENQVGK